ncbi:phosphotransferase family protein [Trujillonella endophytica]|uniref:Predicted kinase, aminoglycoside phosphotransferase (APT) family n=1 Tax=Trujillonella endophytica TaxID=673521 RepID=A0A1H8QSA2_9ACTN|nr:phosphotransferase family protein [Trujillella endophytica]SEO56694.1 Predicted kinase, aminoglycoside phosphotransferase (APT) family [Trujillella endophytica]
MQTQADGVEVVATAGEVRPDRPQPLLVLDAVTAFFDAHGLGGGAVAWERTGDGQSNITYLIRRGADAFVLRRGPRPPLPRSTHDMVREARIQQLLHGSGVPVPRILAVCEDETLLGVPFYAMEWLDGAVITDTVPEALDSEEQRRATSAALVGALAELHSVDVSTGPLAAFGRPEGYLERQVSRFAGLWDTNTTRVLPEVDRLAGWLRDNLPSSEAAAVVHGDYRLGNVMFRRSAPATPLAILDWEMATLGDPLADLGYLTATYSDPGAIPNPLHLSPVTARPGYLSSADLAGDYAARTGADLRALPWYQALALWKAAIFSEAIYTRWLDGQRPDDTTFAPMLEAGVPALLHAASERAHLT